MTNLAGKVALITGSARGIGRAIAERYASLGATVVVNYASSEADAFEVIRAIEAKGGRAIAIQADASKVADLGRLFTDAIERLAAYLALGTARAHGQAAGDRLPEVLLAGQLRQPGRIRSRQCQSS